VPPVVERYQVWLERQPLSERTRREYARQVAGFVEWLAADPAQDGDALADSFARDYAVRDFKRHLKLERRWSPASVNLALAAVDHFLRFVGLGAAEVSRERLPQAAPRALEGEELLAFVRAVERAGARNRAIGMLLVYAGLRLSELVALELDDARVSGRRAVVVVRSGKRDRYREVPLNAPARKALDEWLKKRPAPRPRW
jgi:site-specific recombinase XerC